MQKEKEPKETLPMSSYSRISKAFQHPCRLPLYQDSRYVLFSDCHRGTGRSNDNFLKNEFLYVSALKYYEEQGYTYLELGDGDELWENRSFCAVKSIHPDSFELLGRFFRQDRFYAVYGNHDIIKRKKKFCQTYCQDYFCQCHQCSRSLFPGIRFYSGIILEDQEHQMDIYLTHGHQADFLNSVLWPVSRFLVRYIWRPLEQLGIPDPTSAAKNHRKKKSSEKRLARWAAQQHHLLITGHTHHPMIGTPSSPYSNTGSCISPSGITCIEIQDRCLTLIKWTLGTKPDRTLYVKRVPLGTAICIDDYA
ncbi:metallophosphoesterase [Anaerostipes butyraticus]|nr:metallophosphoesterase [Anaerostipes butyraticus]